MTFERVCALSDLAEDKPQQFQLDDLDVAVVLTGGEVFAIHDECSHAAIPLSEGDIDHCHVECWLHGSRFDLRTGKPDVLPATESVPVYPVRIDGDDVLVDVANPMN